MKTSRTRVEPTSNTPTHLHRSPWKSAGFPADWTWWSVGWREEVDGVRWSEWGSGDWNTSAEMVYGGREEKQEQYTNRTEKDKLYKIPGGGKYKMTSHRSEEVSNFVQLRSTFTVLIMSNVYDMGPLSMCECQCTEPKTNDRPAIVSWWQVVSVACFWIPNPDEHRRDVFVLIGRRFHTSSLNFVSRGLNKCRFRNRLDTQSPRSASILNYGVVGSDFLYFPCSWEKIYGFPLLFSAFFEIFVEKTLGEWEERCWSFAPIVMWTTKKVVT